MNKTLYIFKYILLLAGAVASNHAQAQTIKGNVYGGGEMSKVDGNTNVTINEGKLGADIFGGGEGKLKDDGTVSMSANVSGMTNVTINGGEFAVEPQDVHDPGNDKPFKQRYNIYGGGNLACEVKETHVYVTKGMVSNASAGGSNFLDNDNPTGIAYAYYREGQMYFSIFGGGYGKNTTVTGDTWVDFNISGMTDINSTVIEDDLLEYQSYLDIIGGGFNGIVKGNTNVHIGGNAMCRNVYGGGLYAAIGTLGQSTKGKTNVYITGGNVDNVYGGGVMGDILTSTNVNIGLHDQLTFDGREYAKANDKITVLMSVFGANDVSGKVPQANIVHNGGTVDQNIYGGGNGNYRGYYTPGVCDYAEGDNDNYYPVDHSEDTSQDGKGTKGPKGNTYKGRPQTGNVSITIAGNSTEDKAMVLGQVFGGGNSCTVGAWETNLSTKYDGDPHKWRDDPAYFLGGGNLNITLGSHVKIGRTYEELASASDEDKEAYLAKGENVSGLFMGCSGRYLATQSTAEDDYTYHHYYDAYTAKYWPGFAVFDNNGQPLSREEGLKSFNAYLNNILVWSDNVSLNIADNVEDIWLANFVGGGFRGSMKRKDSGSYNWTLPANVTIGNCIVGGAYNTDVVYRVYDTKDDMHTYTETDGHYNYCTTVKSEWQEGRDYHHIEYADDGTTITGIIRFYYDGGILSKDGTTTADITKLTLANGMNATDASKRRIFAGCFTSGTTQGNTVIDYTGTGAPRVHGGGAYANVAGNATVNIIGGVAGEVYGGGSQADVKGSTFVNLFDGTVTDAYGGGLGLLESGTKGQAGYKAAVEAIVEGNATITLGKENGDGSYTASKVTGSIFGANNVNGTPKGHVKVHVLKTTAREGQGTGDYDVPAIYGGGNQAAYVPSDATFTADKGFAEVLIENCYNSIAYVYGGGNAAPVPATDVKIYGSNAIDNAFAGGNGAGTGNPGADVGYKDYTRDDAHKYGTGKSSIKVYGGTVHNVYGGSNTLGYIRGGAEVSVAQPEAGDTHNCCPLSVGNVYGGGNNADINCDVVMNCNCTEGTDVLYAGANNADVNGNITLNIMSGTYNQVFCGNNSGGAVRGKLTLNVDEIGCWPVMIGELYGCGNNAPYSVYGYNDDKSCKTSGTQLYADPEVNIISCTRIDRVFGGGNGSGATVYGNPTVNINTIKGKFAGQSAQPAYVLDAAGNREANTETITIPDETGTVGTVYGGGNQASVFGNTLVKIGTQSTNKHLNTASEADPKPVSVTILGNVFGGSKGVSNSSAAGRVTGTTKVLIGDE